MTLLSRISLVAVLCWLAAPASAQTCHPASLREPGESGFRLGVTQLFAVYSDVESGSYQGLIPTLSWSHPWVSAEVAAPLYRLAENGSEEALGIGDVAADVRVSVYRTQAFSIGPELAFSLPTGDANRSLGMGHVMAMPGIWARLDAGPFGALAQLAYGGALGEAASSSHAHHHAAMSGAYPRVNPMNRSELEHALGLRYALHPGLSVTARWLGAVPLEAAGVARQILAPGLQLAAAPLDAALELQFPVAGDPFDVRVTVAFGSTF